MPRHHMINGEKVFFTDAEETARDVEEQTWADGANARAMAEIRETRNELLFYTDWWGASDNTINSAQTAYRQALRDYPASWSADNSVAWPTKP